MVYIILYIRLLTKVDPDYYLSNIQFFFSTEFHFAQVSTASPALDADADSPAT